jgi:serine/threonine protein kinase
VPTAVVAILFQEVEVLRRLKHPNVIRIKDFHALRDMRIVIIMEFMAGGELGEFLKKRALTEAEMRLAFLQIVKAIAYCHNEGLIHKDLKPENILLSEPDSL